jgi:hypothetical protein
MACCRRDSRPKSYPRWEGVASLESALHRRVEPSTAREVAAEMGFPGEFASANIVHASWTPVVEGSPTAFLRIWPGFLWHRDTVTGFPKGERPLRRVNGRHPKECGSTGECG